MSIKLRFTGHTICFDQSIPLQQQEEWLTSRGLRVRFGNQKQKVRTDEKGRIIYKQSNPISDISHEHQIEQGITVISDHTKTRYKKLKVKKEQQETELVQQQLEQLKEE